MKKQTMKVAITGVFVTLMGVGCNSTDFNTNTSAAPSSNSAATTNSLASAVSLSVYSGGSLVYSDASTSGQTLQMTAKQTYNFQVEGTNLASGSVLTLQMQDTDIVSGPITSYPLNVGSNTIVAPTQGGDYALTLQVFSNGITQAKHYQSAVGCASSFTKASLNPAGLTATYAGSNNLFNFSAANVVSGANGTGPYLCGFDMTGVGIVDSPYVNCTTAVSNQYVNLVGSRAVGVVVKDSCNVSYSITASPALNLQYTVPTGGTEVAYIYGQVSGATGTAATDARIGSSNYLTTNNTAAKPVQSNYSAGNGAAGAGIFTIGSAFNFGTGNSLPYGMSLKITGLTGLVAASTQSGSIDSSSAVVSAAQYTTDQSGDQEPATSLSSVSCTSGAIHNKVSFVSGAPCSTGDTGDNNSATVEVWGTYVCHMTGSEGTATITGSFDGLYNMVDSCSGGTEGGGGIPPINF